MEPIALRGGDELGEVGGNAELGEVGGNASERKSAAEVEASKSPSEVEEHDESGDEGVTNRCEGAVEGR